MNEAAPMAVENFENDMRGALDHLEKIISGVREAQNNGQANLADLLGRLCGIEAPVPLMSEGTKLPTRPGVLGFFISRAEGLAGQVVMLREQSETTNRTVQELRIRLLDNRQEPMAMSDYGTKAEMTAMMAGVGAQCKRAY